MKNLEITYCSAMQYNIPVTRSSFIRLIDSLCDVSNIFLVLGIQSQTVE